jgi:hypothetical protein
VLKYVGSTLIQVCIGEHEVTMNFDRDMSLSIETELSTHLAGDGPSHWMAPPQAGSAVIDLFGAAVKGPQLDANGNLILSLEPGQVSIRRGTSGYESFQIEASGLLLVY